jgi:hypothetical protein
MLVLKAESRFDNLTWMLQKSLYLFPFWFPDAPKRGILIALSSSEVSRVCRSKSNKLVLR